MLLLLQVLGLVSDLRYLPAAIKMAGRLLRNRKDMSIMELRRSWATVISSGEHAAHADRDYPQFMGSLFQLALDQLERSNGIKTNEYQDCLLLLFIVSLWDSPKLDNDQVSILTSGLSIPTTERLTKLTEKMRIVGLWGRDEETLSHRLTIAPAQQVPLGQMFPHDCARRSNLVFNNILKLLSKSGSQHTQDNAVNLFKKMRQLCVTDMVTYNILLNLFVDGPTTAIRKEQALKWFDVMKEDGVSPDAYCYNTIIKLFARHNQKKEALEFFNCMKKAGVSPDAVTYNTLIHLLFKLGNVADALECFASMRTAGLSPDTYTYSTMIKAYCQGGDVKTAVALKDSMVADGVAPDANHESLQRCQR